MFEQPWDESFFAECAARLVRVEQKLTNTQIEYLREYYTTNTFPSDEELTAIAKNWNIDDFHFHFNLGEWFFGRRMADQQVTDRRDKARKAAA